MIKRVILLACLATVFLSPIVMAETDETIITVLKESATRGNAPSMTLIGNRYRKGEGVPKDYTIAMEWYKKAAEKGNVYAMSYIADMYYEGEGVPKDYTIAMEWYKKAAEKGDVYAMDDIANMYSKGEGVAKDYDIALDWHKKVVATTDDDYSIYNMAMMYREGKDVLQDYTIAMEWYKKVAAMDGSFSSLAMSRIADMYYEGEGVPKDYTIAMEWYKKAAEKGDVYAMDDIANMYSKGEGVAKDYTIAMEWYKKVAAMDGSFSSLAMSRIADMYYEGEGVPQNPNTAAQLYVQAYKLESKKSSASEYILNLINQDLDNLLASGEITDPAIRREIESLFDKPPLIAWKTQPPSTVDRESLTLSVNLTDQGGGIGDVRILLDGVAVDQSGRGLYRQVDQETQDFTLTIPEGKHTLTVEAYAAENLGTTNKVTHQIISKYKPLQKPKLHAVIIGINTYKNPRLELVNAVNDADAIYKTLNKQIGSLYDKGSISLLNTVDTTSRKNIINKINLIKQTAKMGDVFVFYAAAHGYNFPDTGYHLFTSDVGATSSRQVKTTGINAGELQGLLAQVTTNKKLILLDTCDSGGSIDAGQLLPVSRGLDDQKVIDKMQRKSGATVIMASTDRQRALEKYKGHGVFTYTLLQAFAGKGDIGENKYISTLDLIQHVEKNVPLLAEKAFNHKQFPTISMTGNGFEFKVFQQIDR